MQNKLLNLKNLIILLAFSVAFITLTNGFYANYRVQKSQLIKHSLDTNHSYAQKLAAATDNFIAAAHQQLAFAARIIEKNLDNQALIMREAERIHLQTPSFNSVVIVNNQGVALATSPNTLGIIGGKILSIGAQEALKAQKPMISTPYLSTADNFLILISSPLFSKEGEYLGYVGGTIYLKENSILNDLLGRHFHQDGSYIYVVDKNKRIIYHPVAKRIGDYINNNEVISKVTNNISGSEEVINSNNINMLAGYAPIITTGWGVVAQRPVIATLSSIDNLMQQVFYRTLPLGIFTFISIWLLANYISRPLRQLADTAQKMDCPNAQNSLTNIQSWYFETEK